MARRAPLAVAAVSALVALGLAGCGSNGSDGSDGSAPAEGLTQEGRSRALAAAVISAVEGPAGHGPSAAAPIFPRDQLLPRGGLGVEAVFPQDDEASLHVRLVIAPPDDPDYAPGACGPSEPRLGCEEQEVDGTPTVLEWDAGYPEEDPGSISAVGSQEGRLVVVSAFGPFIEPDLEGRRAIAEALVELVADPEVGFEPSESLAEAGTKISDDVWRDWYGQGNGSSAPPGLEPEG